MEPLYVSWGFHAEVMPILYKKLQGLDLVLDTGRYSTSRRHHRLLHLLLIHRGSLAGNVICIAVRCSLERELVAFGCEEKSRTKVLFSGRENTHVLTDNRVFKWPSSSKRKPQHKFSEHVLNFHSGL